VGGECGTCSTHKENKKCIQRFSQRRSSGYIVNINLKEIECEGVEYVQLAQDRVQSFIVNPAINS
jgi:hypothetical protein